MYLFKKWLTKKTFLKQKKVFFVNHFLKRYKLCIFCFKKVFFCQPFFEKILFVCVVALPSNTIFVRKSFGKVPENLPFLIYPFKNSIFVSFLLGHKKCIFSNTIFEGIEYIQGVQGYIWKTFVVSFSTNNYKKTYVIFTFRTIFYNIINTLTHR